jgi:hypothetical protein
MSGQFAVISPDVLLVGNKKLTLSLLPAKALLKVHRNILYYFPFTVNYENTAFHGHLRLLHSLNDMYPGEPTVEDIELFRGHIIKFVGVWHSSTEHLRNYGNLNSLKAMANSKNSVNAKKVQATIDVESSEANKQLVQISDSGNLVLVKKDVVPATNTTDADALAALKLRVTALKDRLNLCTDGGTKIFGYNSDPNCTVQKLDEEFEKLGK